MNLTRQKKNKLLLVGLFVVDTLWDYFFLFFYDSDLSLYSFVQVIPRSRQTKTKTGVEGRGCRLAAYGWE